MIPLASSFPDRVTLQGVLEVAAQAPSSGNLQPWRWRVEDAAIHLHADWRRQAGGSLEARRDVLLGCGAVLDHCIVALAAAGWSPRVQRFPGGRDDGHLAILEVIEQPPNPAHLELAEAISRRRADLRRYPARPIPDAALELMYIRAARLGVRLAVVPRSQWVRNENGTVELRFPAVGPDPEDGSDPEDGAVLLVLGTPRDNDHARLRAGEALSHLTLTANAMGLASCPLTEPLNDMRTRLGLAVEVFGGDAHPQTLIRVGPPPEDNALEPLTGRRPVSETTTWTT